MKRLLAALTLALVVSSVLAVGATAAPGSGGGNMDSASGTVTQVGIFGFQDTFSAKSSSLGTDAQGYWKRTTTNTDPNTVITGDIRCLRVSGNLFEARGVIVDTRNTGGPGFPQGFVVRGSDGGKFQSTPPDTYDATLFSTPQLEDSCLAPAPWFPVQNGEIIVKDAF
jgi:hypothetical protein